MQSPIHIEAGGAASSPPAFGFTQSPINIETDKAASSPYLTNALVPNLNETALRMVSKPHTVMLESTGTTHDSTIKIRGQKFSFLQVHWHTPSEHTINGNYYTMEAHFVFQENKTERLAVLAVLYQTRPYQSCNLQLDSFWNQVPAYNHTGMVSAQLAVAYPLQSIVESLLGGGYYWYDGSLTTPPYTEGVQWIVFKSHFPICEDQVNTLKRYLSASQRNTRLYADLETNNRPVQPLNLRVVSMTPPPPSEVGSIFSGVVFACLLLLLLCLSVVCCLKRCGGVVGRRGGGPCTGPVVKGESGRLWASGEVTLVGPDAESEVCGSAA